MAMSCDQKGSLTLVGTPIGNLGDFSPRAVEALENAARKLGYSDIKFIDPAPAIARRLSEVIDEYNIPRNEGYAIELLSSGPGDTLNYLYK